MAIKSTPPDSRTTAVSPASAASLPPTSAIGSPPTYTKSPPSHHNATSPPTPSPSPAIASSPPPSIPPETSPLPVGSPPPFTSPPPTNSPPPTASSPPPAPVAKPPTNSPPKRKRSPPPPPAVGPPETSLSPVPSIVPSPVNAPLPPKLTPPASHHSPPPPSHNSPSYSPPASSSPSSSGGIDTVGAVAIGVAAGVFMVTLIGLIVWCLRKRKRGASSGLNGGHVMPYPSGSPLPSDSASSKMSSTPPFMGSGYTSGTPRAPTDPGGLGNSTSWFTHEQLVEATNGFSLQNLLGEGGFGSVYKGYLPDGKVVAVKQLKIGGGQGEREFKAEVEIISRVHHRHLVSLVGYCIYKNSRLLVYEYVPNNTLHSHLHGEGWPVLDWVMRVKIAAGAARGIAYLHEDCYPRIIHRDIKSSNILLDNNYEAKVSDFGLAKLAVDANTHVTTRVMGTFGYLAPEYASSGKLTDKSDVFSYGVVLLELITGRKPVDPSQPSGNESLVEWARPLLSYALENEEFDDLVDPKLGKNYVEIEMFRMIEAAAACVRHSAAKRPRMGQIVRAFDGLVAADLSNGMRVGESEVFNSAPQSAEIRLLRRMAFGDPKLSTDLFSLGSLGTGEHTANTSREQYQYRSSISGPESQTEVKP